MIDAYICFALLIIAPRLSILPYSTPRRVALAFGAPLALAMGGWRITVPALLALCLVLLVVVAGAMSKRRDIAGRYSLVLYGAVALGSAASPDVLPLMVWCAVVHSVVHLWQDITGRYSLGDPLASGSGGLAGNTAHLGTYLVGHVFLAVHLSMFWAVPIIVAALVASRCRGALAGLAAGVVAIEPWTLGLWIAGAVLFAHRIDTRGARTLGFRLDAIRTVGKYLTTRVAFCGLGGDVGRCSFAAETGFTRLHNDFIQAIFDAGIPAALLLLAAGLSSIWSAPPWMAGAVVSMMVAGMFLHVQHIALTTLAFLVIVLSGAGPVTDPGWIGIVSGMVLVPVAWVAWGREMLSDFAFRRWQATDDWRHLAAAYRLSPRSGPINVVLSVMAYNSGRLRESIHHAVDAIEFFDGDAYLPTAHYAAGMSWSTAGEIDLARHHLTKACELEPSDEDYRNALEKLNKKKVL